MNEETTRSVDKMNEHSDVGKIWITIGNRTYYINVDEYRKLEKFRKGKK